MLKSPAVNLYKCLSLLLMCGYFLWVLVTWTHLLLLCYSRHDWVHVISTLDVLEYMSFYSRHIQVHVRLICTKQVLLYTMSVIYSTKVLQNSVLYFLTFKFKSTCYKCKINNIFKDPNPLISAVCMAIGIICMLAD